MTSPRSRRTFLTTVASSLSLASAGCLSDGFGPRSGGTDTTTAPTPDSKPDTASPTETATPWPPTTKTCDEQATMADVTIENERESTVTVDVTLVRNESGAESVFRERTYVVEPGAYAKDAEKLFADVSDDPPADVSFTAKVTVANRSGSTGHLARTTDVTVVAANPWNYGIFVAIGADGLSVTPWHFDPGPRVNRNCY